MNDRMNTVVYTTSTCSCAWCQRIEPIRSRYAQCFHRWWDAVFDAVDAGIAVLVPEGHPSRATYSNTRTCRSCGTDESVSRRHKYVGSWWVNLGCGHTQNDDEY